MNFDEPFWNEQQPQRTGHVKTVQQVACSVVSIMVMPTLTV
ncbi:hypothetical protein SMC26_44665 [Actinomadura fulvescens]